jgi:ATP-binding cassette subfamily F protein uup
MPALVTCEDLRQTFGARTLFDGIAISINDGERVGLIGPNGSGKSTLLKILGGLETPSSGTRSARRNLRVGYLPQEDEFAPGESARSALADALRDEPIEEHERDNRVAAQLSRLEFESPDQPVAERSGGWRKRLALGRVMIQEPELLLLDEPTNHLDIEAIGWLERFLLSSRTALLMVSHDRYLLEVVCTRIIELNAVFPGGSFSVDGPYSRYLEKREEFLEGQLRQQQSLANKVRREVEWLRRGPKARTTKAKFRVDEAGRLMDGLAAMQHRQSQARSMSVDFSESDRRRNKLIVLKEVKLSRGGRALFQGLDLHLERGQKLGLLGGNGAGKSSLLKLMTKECTPDEGEVVIGEGLRIALFDQNRGQLDLDRPLRHALSPTGDQVVFQGKSTHIEAWSKRFLFRSEQLDLPLRHLSGGEQARVLLAQMMLCPADVLLLDEPTNDLDMASLDVLESSLIEFSGAVVLVTHDRYLLERVSTSLLGLDGRGGHGFYPDVDDWSAAVAAARESSKPAPTRGQAPPAKAPNKTKGLTYKEKQELAGMQSAIEKAEEKLAKVQEEIADPAVSTDHVRLSAACRSLEEAQAEVNRLYQRWEELERKENP